MAKHYRRKHSSSRGYGAFFPKLSDIKGSVKGTDALIGVAIGLAGYLAMRYAAKQYSATYLKIPEFIRNNALAAGPILAGLIGYAAAKKWKPGMANSVLVGSLGGGLALFGLAKVDASTWANENLAKVAGYGDMGLLAPDAPYGMIASDTQGYGRAEAELNQMAAFAAQSDIDEVLN